MSFVEEFRRLDAKGLIAASMAASATAVEQSAHVARPHLGDFANLISPAGTHQLEQLGRRAAELTRQRFGKVIRLFAPLYLSNECINNCRYCGFSRDNAIVRVTLSVEDVLREARALKEQGFRNLLLVAGEHPKFVSTGYLQQCVEALREEVPGISLEVGPMGTDSYRSLAQAGADGLVVYQETYDRAVYAQMHTAGPKRDFDWRLATPERAYVGGFRRLGIGALYGMSDWRHEAISLAAHADYLLRHCWKAQLTLSLPRLRPCAGEFDPTQPISDRELLQLVCALRIFLPDAGIVLSTREPARLRNGLIPLGVTMMSAGSHTEPGGYTGAGREHLHFTKRGRIVPLTENASEWSAADGATGQFEIADERSPEEVASVIARLGFEPVWKDWDAAIMATD